MFGIWDPKIHNSKYTKAVAENTRKDSLDIILKHP